MEMLINCLVELYDFLTTIIAKNLRGSITFFRFSYCDQVTNLMKHKSAPDETWHFLNKKGGSVIG